LRAQIKRIQSDIETINSFNATPGNGITRATFSPEYQAAINYVKKELEKIGARTAICRGGNIRGRLAGSGQDSRAIMMGSHLDTVAHGGEFDGVVGVVTALEVARIFAEDKIPHQRPVDVVVFAEEEGSRFGRGLLGSSVWTGLLETEQLSSIKDNRGVSYLEAMELAGLADTDNSRLKSPNLGAMLEVHIEQGAVLEKRGCQIGVVKAIAGIRQLNITVKGTADHAGTTPMEDRFDPLQAAARIIIEVDQIARDAGPNAVATVGRITCDPAQVNVIPGLVNFSVDVRDSNRPVLQSTVSKINQAVKNICDERGLVFEIVELSEAEPVTLSTSIVDLMEENAKRIGVNPYKMISGAGHDTALLAELTEAGMIFIPSRDGLSHCPQEYSRLDDIALGCEILLATATQLAS